MTDSRPVPHRVAPLLEAMPPQTRKEAPMRRARMLAVSATMAWVSLGCAPESPKPIPTCPVRPPLGSEGCTATLADRCQWDMPCGRTLKCSCRESDGVPLFGGSGGGTWPWSCAPGLKPYCPACAQYRYDSDCLKAFYDCKLDAGAGGQTCMTQFGGADAAGVD